jgi:hypothetical protein
MEMLARGALAATKAAFSPQPTNNDEIKVHAKFFAADAPAPRVRNSVWRGKWREVPRLRRC